MLSDPGALKSGEWLEEHIADALKTFVSSDREGVVAALAEWIAMRDEPRSMIAVRMAMKYRLKELRDPIAALRKDVESGKVFLPFYKKKIDAALDELA